MAKLNRSVLSGMCGYAARQDALDRNPVRDASRGSRTAKAPPCPLTLAQARQLRAMLTYDELAVERDLPDLVSFMLATGLRIGEASVVRWEDVDLEDGILRRRHRDPAHGQGPGPQARDQDRRRDAHTRPVPVVHRAPPSAAQERGHRGGSRGSRLPAPKGGLRDPSNTQRHLRDALEWAGLPRATSHVFRKTTATMLDHAGVSARAIAAHLGHAQPSLTQNVYLARNIASPDAARTLDDLK